MAAIANRRFVFFDDRHLLLANEEYCRKMQWQSAWSRIRIGFLAAVNANGTSNITDCLCAFGVCSGNTAPVSAYAADSFIGASLIGNIAPLSTRTLTYNGGVNPYYSGTTGQIFRKNGAFNSTAALSAQAFFPLAATGTQRRRAPFFIDIQRGTAGGSAGTVTISVYGCSSSTVLFDYRPDHLLDGLDQIGTPVIYGQTMTVLVTNSSTLSISDASGALDTLCLYWSRAAYPLEVYAVGACVIADNGWQPGEQGGAIEFFGSYPPITNIPSSGLLTGGRGWAAQGTVYGTYANDYPQVGLAGTSSGFPYDAFRNYGTTSNVYGTSINAGTGWASSATFYGSLAVSALPQYGLAGTTANMPWDTFESYAVGAVVSGVTVNSGSGWGGAAIIN